MGVMVDELLLLARSTRPASPNALRSISRASSTMPSPTPAPPIPIAPSASCTP